MSTQELLESYGKIKQCEGKLDAINNIALPAIERIRAKMDTAFDQSETRQKSLREHIDDQEKSNIEYAQWYKKQMAKQDEDAKQFVLNSTDEELKTWLADQPIAYHSWKDACHDVLVELVMNVYDE